VIEQRHNDLCYVQFNHLFQFPEIAHGVFTRLGGYSQEPYRSLNISLSSGDSLDNVMHNRLLTLQTLQLEAYPCATLWLVHGADVATLDMDDAWEDWRFDWPYRSYCIGQQEITWTFKPRRKADAIITRQRGVTLALPIGDCPPILFYDPVQGVLGMAHAGWRGTARGVAAATIATMSEQFGCLPRDIYAGIGPSIGPCCYEVSAEVQHLFQGETQFGEMPTAEKYCNLVRESAVFVRQQRSNSRADGMHKLLYLDLWQTNRNQLLMAGLSAEHIELPEICTCCNTDRFFSHRGEYGKTGRFPAILALRNS
jgi:YfiH family protein